MTILHTIILGIVEGVTEFLPISSTAHMDIVRSLLSIPSSEFIKSFEIIIQLGAISAVVLLYFKRIFSSWIYFRNICIAFLPTGIIGFILYKIIKTFLLGNTILAVWTLLFGGVVIIIYEWRQGKNDKVVMSKTVESLSVKELLILGCAQSLAVIPGVSRSGAVIIAGRIIKLPTSVIVEFSFLLAVPTMLAATLYEILKSGLSFGSSGWGIIGIGFITAFIVALFVIKWLLDYIRNHSFMVFGWYRVVLGIVLLIFFMA